MSHFFAVFEAGDGTDEEMIEAATERASEFGDPTGPVHLSAHCLEVGEIVVVVLEYVPNRRPCEVLNDPGAWMPFIRRYC